MRIRKVSQPSALPVDTAQVVDSYSTSATDAYSANYINNLVKYSDTEQVIGTWLGSPLYRKVLSFTTGSSAGDLSVPHNISNLGVVIRAYGYGFDGANSYFPLYSVYRDMSGIYAFSVYRVNDTYVMITYGSQRTNYTGHVILEYTKAS